MRVAAEAVFADILTWLDLDQTHIQPGMAIAGERQRAGDVEGAKHWIDDPSRGAVHQGEREIIHDAMARTDLHAGPVTGNLPALPCCWRRPGAILGRADQGRQILS